MAKGKMSADERKWRAEDDLRTLTRANEITADASRMRAARSMHRQQMRSMQKVGSMMKGKR